MTELCHPFWPSISTRNGDTQERLMTEKLSELLAPKQVSYWYLVDHGVLRMWNGILFPSKNWYTGVRDCVILWKTPDDFLTSQLIKQTPRFASWKRAFFGSKLIRPHLLVAISEPYQLMENNRTDCTWSGWLSVPKQKGLSVNGMLFSVITNAGTCSLTSKC